MIEIDIPGFKILRLNHLVLDYNGTIACDGKLLPGVKEGLSALAEVLSIHVLTADTFGRARSFLDDIPCEVAVIADEYQDCNLQQKDEAVFRLRVKNQSSRVYLVEIHTRRTEATASEIDLELEVVWFICMIERFLHGYHLGLE